MMTCDASMYSSSWPIDSRSSTSRKIDTLGKRRQSCRLIEAHWSCAVDQMCERKRCQRCPWPRERRGGALVASSLSSGARAATTICFTVTTNTSMTEPAIDPIRPSVTVATSK